MEQTAAALFTAVEHGDLGALAELYHDDIVVWHSFSNKQQGKSDNIALLSEMRAAAAAMRYEVLERVMVGDRFVQRHLLHVTMPDTSVVAIPAVIFMTIRHGQIASIEEYVDSAHIFSLRDRLLNGTELAPGSLI